MRRAEDAGPPLRKLSPRWAGQGDSHLSRVQAGGAQGAGASGAPAAEGRRAGTMAHGATAPHPNRRGNSGGCQMRRLFEKTQKSGLKGNVFLCFYMFSNSNLNIV